LKQSLRTYGRLTASKRVRKISKKNHAMNLMTGGAYVVAGVCFERGKKEKRKASAVGLGFLERSALDGLGILTST